MFGLGEKTCFSLSFFLFMKSKGVNFAEMCIILSSNWRYSNFFQQGLIFLENNNFWFSFLFTVLPKHIKIQSPLKYTSICGRVVKLSGLSTALSSHDRSIRGSSLDGARFTHHFFFCNFELVYCLLAFHC